MQQEQLQQINKNFGLVSALIFLCSAGIFAMNFTQTEEVLGIVYPAHANLVGETLKNFVGWSVLPAFLGVFLTFNKKIPSASRVILVLISVAGLIASVMSFVLMGISLIDCSSPCVYAGFPYGWVVAPLIAIVWVVLPIFMLVLKAKK